MRPLQWSHGWIALGVMALCSCTDNGGRSDGAGTDTDVATDSGGSDTDTDTDGDTGGLPPIDPDICPGLEFSNVVDEASCESIQGRGLTPTFADEVELCRRLFVDLAGSLPTQAQFDDTCAGKTADQIAADLMARPEYVGLGQRLWADIFLMTSDLTLYTYLEQLDDLVGQLYRGEMLLPQFAEIAVTHPGFTGRFDGQDLVGYSFQAFLGRDASPHERLGLEPLWHLWQDRYEDQHPMYYFGYSRGVINTILCMGSSEGACHSDLWGHHSVVIPVVEEGNYDYDGVNVFAQENLTADQWNTLRLPGRLITQQTTFYETAADRALERYLGYDAGHELPKVRQVLVDMLEESGGDVLALEREILGSQLYTMTNLWQPDENTPMVEEVPEYWRGPLKQLPAEAWLDSLEKLSQVEIGQCDHRFPDVVGGRPLETSPYEDTWWHPSTFPLDDDPTFPPERNKPDYTYRDLAQALGGCPDQQGQLRFTGTGVMLAISFEAISRQVCELAVEGSALHPAGLAGMQKTEAELSGISDAIHGAVFTRATPAGLEPARDGAVQGCRDASECDATMFARETCSAFLKSAPFIFY